MNLSSIKQENAIKTYCKDCDEYYDVTKDQIFSGECSMYYAICPYCKVAKSLPSTEVIKVFGELRV